MTPSSQNNNLIGSLWMIAAMAAFAVEDTFIKMAFAHVPVGQILMLFGGFGAMIFAGLAKRNGDPLFPPQAFAPAMQLRVAFELFGRLFYVLAITLTPLSSATAILQATPLVVVAFAALIFGETVGWRRWSAIAIGLVGVLIIVQPGGDDFTPLSIFAVLGMLGLAGRDLASRVAPMTISTSVLGFHGFLTVIVAGILFAAWEGVIFPPLTLRPALAILAATVAGVFAYSSLMKAMRTGDVSAVTPFRYSRLLFGVGIGVVVFGERLTPSMMLGCALIVVAGLFIMWRSKT